MPLLADGGRSWDGILPLCCPSDHDAAQRRLLSALSAEDLVARARLESRYLGREMTTDRHVVLAAVRLAGRPELAGLRHLESISRAPMRSVRARGFPPEGPNQTGSCRDGAKRRVITSHVEPRGSLRVGIEVVEVRSTGTLVNWGLGARRRARRCG